MKVKITANGKEFIFDPEEKAKAIEYSPEAITAVRGYFYLLKAIRGLPRIYGLPKGDPVESWRAEFLNRLLKALAGEAEVTRVYPQVSFEILTESLRVSGGVKGTSISADVEVLKRPQVSGQGAYAMLQVDSEMQRGIVKVNPFILPAERVGFFYAFSKFAFAGGEERPSGIPKALGIAAEFINGFIMVGELRAKVRGLECKGGPNEEIQCNGIPINSLTPDVLDELVFKIASSLTKENDVLIIELPELYKTREETVNLLKDIRANLVVVTEDTSLVRP